MALAFLVLTSCVGAIADGILGAHRLARQTGQEIGWRLWDQSYGARVIRNVIFDWSGTLVDDLPAVWRACNHVFERAGVEALSLERFRAEVELPLSGFYKRYLKSTNEADLERWFFDGLARWHDSVEPLPHAAEFLEFCRDNGFRTLVFTAVPAPLLEIQMRRFGWGQYFDHLHPGVIDKRLLIDGILQGHGWSPAETVFIGDMEHDITAARKAGVGNVAVLTGYDTLPKLRAAGPDRIVEHLGELRRLMTHGGKAIEVDFTSAAENDVMKHPIATVGGLVFDVAGRMLLVRTNKWSSLWGIPGGKIGWGETCEDALKRELKEETGLDVRDIRWVMLQDAICPPEFYKEAHFLLHNYICNIEGAADVRLNDEAQEYRWVNWDEAWKIELNTPTRRLLEVVDGLLNPG